MAHLRIDTLVSSYRLFSQAMDDLNHRNMGLIAAGVAFYGMLAIFPGVAAVIAIWSLIADPVIVDQQLELARGFLPAEAFRVLDQQIGQLIDTTSGRLGWATLISILAALWSSRAGVAALIRGLNLSYRTPNRTGFRQTATALLLTLTLVGVSLISLACIVVLPIALAFLPLGPVTAWLVGSVRWIVALAVMVVGLGLLYRFGPNRRGARPGWFTAGTVLAVALWGAVSWGFSFYLANFGNYNEIYGTLGAAIALLMWFYLSAYIVLLGAMLNHHLETRRSTRDACFYDGDSSGLVDEKKIA